MWSRHWALSLSCVWLVNAAVPARAEPVPVATEQTITHQAVADQASAVAGSCRAPGAAGLKPVRCLQEDTPGAVDEEFARLGSDVDRARLLFCRGVQKLGSDNTDALACLARSSELRPHAITLLNVAIAEVQLERYTRARSAVQRALSRHSQAPELCLAGQETCPALEQARALLRFCDEKQLVTLKVTLDPPDSRLWVDGRPLTPSLEAQPGPRFSAGLDQGEGTTVTPGAVFELTLDPGYHAFSVESKGFRKNTLRRSYRPAERGELRIELQRLPALLSIRSSLADAIVQVDGVDVGPAPVDVQRPPGNHRVLVLKPGFEPYEARVNVAGGEALSLQARLVEQAPPIHERWWFWVGIGGFLASSALIYHVSQPEPAPPPYDGGSTRWVIDPSAR